MSAPTVPGGGAGDHEVSQALVRRYARAADERDIAELAALFPPEPEVTGARGTQTIADWLDTMRAPAPSPPACTCRVTR